MTSPGTCSKCPSDKAICLGGKKIGPKPGFWRKSNATGFFVECPNYAACLGMIAPDYNPMGSCEIGYEGILCTECKPGYSRSGDFKCGKCPEKVSNIIRLVFIFIIAIGIMVFVIRSTLAGARQRNNVTSIFLKILMNHFQLLVLSASFNFNWPRVVIQFFDTAKPIAQAS